MIGPDDVGRVAEDEGIPRSIISTLDASRDPRLAGALQSLARRTGGELYWAPRWQDQTIAFKAVREDIASSYTAYYYPAPDCDPGYRRIQVEMLAPEGAKWHVRARAGYEAKPESSR
jgi:hypothetical protein